MYMTLDALADGGVYAGVPKEQAINLVAHTMMVSEHQKSMYVIIVIPLTGRDQLKWFLKMANILKQ